jgi:hypothetical protein
VEPQKPSSKKSQKNSLLHQTLWVWFITMVATRLLFELQRIRFFKQNLALFTALLLIYVPMAVLWYRKEKIPFFDLSWRQFLKSIGWFLLTAILVFPLVEVGNRYFQEWFFHQHYVGGNLRGISKVAWFHLFLIAIPEEFFYRGYLQFQLNRVWGKPVRFLGTWVGKGYLIAAFLFAFSHSMIVLRWWHFSIFFPALLFGWLKEKTNSITASALFHAACNVYSYWIVLNYHLIR